MNTKIAIVLLIVWLIVLIHSLFEYQAQHLEQVEGEEFGLYFVE